MKKRAVVFGRVIAKKLILREWKLEAVVMFDLWWSETANTLHLKRLRLCNEDRADVFDKIWEPLLKFLWGKD